jgi:multiple sugar transport system ATP-binding protein
MANVILSNITKRFGKFIAVKNMNLDIKDGKFVTLVGPSGCGKTTTLRMIAGLEDITSGELRIGGKFSNYIQPKDRGISMVFQSYALFPHMTVAENIAFGLKIKRVGREAILKKINWVLDLLDLTGLDDRRPRELSGGQRQRVALGRALVLDPEVLLLDEPLSNLDAKLRLKMRTELKRIHRKIGSTVVYVTHDQVEAMTLSDEIAVMNKSLLMQVGTPLEVYDKPENKFVAGFLGSPPMNFIPVDLVKDNAKLCLDVKDFKLLIPDVKTAIVKKNAKVGEKLIFGFRPEDVIRIEKAKDVHQRNKIETVIDVIEPMGSELILSLTTGKHIIQASIAPDSHLKVGQKLTVVVDTDKIHLFKLDSEKAIF